MNPLRVFEKMIIKKTLIFVSLLAFCTLTKAQNTDKVESAFKAGKATHMHSDLASEVEVSLDNDVHFLSSDEVVKLLDTWFAKVKPNGFKGAIAGGSSVKYYSGHLQTSSGNHKVLIYFNTHKDVYKIDEIRITKHSD